MPPYPYNRITNIGGRPGVGKPAIPEIFFQMTEAQIVTALMSVGYAKGQAEKEARNFMEYKERLQPQQIWEDEELEPEYPPEDDQPGTSFGAGVRALKEQGKQNQGGAEDD